MGSYVDLAIPSPFFHEVALKKSVCDIVEKA